MCISYLHATLNALQEKQSVEAELEVLYSDKERLAEKLVAGNLQLRTVEEEVQAVVATGSSPVSFPPDSQPSACPQVMLSPVISSYYRPL